MKQEATMLILFKKNHAHDPAKSPYYNNNTFSVHPVLQTIALILMYIRRPSWIAKLSFVIQITTQQKHGCYFVNSRLASEI